MFASTKVALCLQNKCHAMGAGQARPSPGSNKVAYLTAEGFQSLLSRRKSSKPIQQNGNCHFGHPGHRQVACHQANRFWFPNPHLPDQGHGVLCQVPGEQLSERARNQGGLTALLWISNNCDAQYTNGQLPKPRSWLQAEFPFFPGQ